jgi:S1-C subfamily serine protease
VSYEDYDTGRTLTPSRILAVAAILVAVGVSLFAVVTVRDQNMRVDLLQEDVRDLEGRLEAFRLADQELSGRLKSSETKLKQKDQGVAPLAAKVLKSVFTVNTDEGLGAGFAGWITDGQLYVVTAAHVVDSVGQKVTLERNNGSWAAEVVKRNAERDLAATPAGRRSTARGASSASSSRVAARTSTSRSRSASSAARSAPAEQPYSYVAGS